MAFSAARSWLEARLGRKILAATIFSLLLASTVFLGLFVALYHQTLASERSEAARRVNRLLQISLENAMLKRDLEGLSLIVERLGQEPSVAGAMILAPSGETRFSSDAARLGQILRVEPGESLLDDPEHGHILRSVNPVHNRAPCAVCHGPVESHPVNGVLVIDYKADMLRGAALRSAALFMGAGFLAACAGGLGAWAAIRRWALRPARLLTEASARMGGGDLSARSGFAGPDEMGVLARSFDEMAGRLERAHGEMAANEAFQQALIDSLPDAARVISGENGRVLRVNRAFIELHGEGPPGAGGPVGLPCHMASHGRADPCPPTLEVCPLQLLRDGRLDGPISFRARHRRASGASCLVEVKAAPILIPREGGGAPLKGVVESIRDLEADIQASHEQKLADLSVLAAGVAHEIRNPLGAMSFALSEASSAAVAQEPAQAREYLEVAQAQIERCLSVTNSLLSLSSPAPAEPELVDLASAIRETMALLAPEAEKGGVTVAFGLTPGLRALASNAELRRIVVNLAQNAFHAMPGGGLLVISTRAEGGRILIAFEDTGCGIAPEDAPRIFQPFWSRRADGARGTGLGLTLCRKAVESWGGDISVDSAPGKGARFTLSLPAPDAAP